MQCDQRAEWPRTLILLSTLLQEKKFHQNWYFQHLFWVLLLPVGRRFHTRADWNAIMQTLIWRNVGRFVYKSFDIYLRWIVEVGGEIAPGWFFVLQQCVFISSHLHRMQKMRHFRATRRQWNVEHYLNWRGLPSKWKNSLSFSMRFNCLPVTVHRKVEKHGECGGPKANLFDLTPRRLLNFQRFPCGPAPPAYCGAFARLASPSGRKNVMSMRELFCPDPLAGLEKMAGFQIFYCPKIKCFHS